ncbi:Leucine Rich Repeat family protein [Histomonas meleagridis]|uniref:Leucine Rich Repeat family protein n=1 Tax=Histomonas meleagridis TaxID=135588 RepID=UPI0035599400|nr:Leucine Rich Repeat family protein [Histomonas meleagridis]KAH0796662.1 Leucine Rich Repeat family protein [Histomonas meleagridis]
MVDKEVEAHLKEIMKGRTENVIDARWVEKISSNHRKEKRVLVLTESSFSLYKTKAFSKLPKPSKRHTWFELKKLEAPSTKTLSFSFVDENITFSSDSTDVILKRIVPHLQQILTKSEMPTITISKYSSLDDSKLSPLRGVSRLRARLYTERPTTPEDLLNTYQDFLKSGKTNLDVSQIAIHHYYASLLDSLSVVPTVTSLEVPTSENSHWQEIGHFLANSQYVDTFITSEKIDSHFSEFLAELEKSKHKRLKSVTFSCPKISDADISTIISIVQKREIQSLTIVRSINKHTFDLLCSGLSNVQSLKSFIVDHVEYIDVLKVIRTIPNLQRFGIINSDFDLSSIISSLSNNQDLMISTLDFSGNRFKSSFKKQIILSNNITTLILNDVDFKGNSFESLFFKLVLKSPLPISVSLNRFKISESKWQSFQKVLSQIYEEGQTFNLQGLYWEENQVFPLFFSFLDCCQPLTLLSLNGCFDGSEGITFQNLCQFISSTKTITDLRLSGTANKKLSSQALIQVLNSLKNDNRQIKKIDISNNQFDEKVLEVLGEVLMANRHIEYVDFRNNGILNASAFKKLFSTLLQRGKPLHFPFPTYEMYEMLSKNTISIDNLNEFKSQVEKINEGNQSIQVPSDSIKNSNVNKPQYQTNQENADDEQSYESSDDEDWLGFTSQIPPIDNYEIEAELAEQYSIPKIIEKIRSH